ncbi:MAG: YraN family protein [Clostridia bacterium]|nr:YraN family protein [Clostridia bacterium]
MTKELGNLGENLAMEKLKDMGYKIICRNFTCRLGEIDIIAQDKDILVFIEVRSRKADTYGFPSETVNFRKQQKLRKVAQYYLMINNLENVYCRFDVVSIIWNKGKRIEIEVIKDAF